MKTIIRKLKNIKIAKGKFLWPLLIPIFLLIISAIFARFYPPEIFIHWTEQGWPDWLVGKLTGLLFLPLLTTFFAVADIIFKNTKSYKKLPATVAKNYAEFLLVILLFLAYFHLAIIAWNLRPFSFHFSLAIVPALSALVYYFGVWLLKIGSRRVVVKNLGKFLKVAGCLSLVGVIFPSSALTIFYTLLIFSVIFSFLIKIKLKKEIF